ncbi:cytosolic protein [Virgibacillus ndiopensis]|uniref:cytosolic protein n=1 Tax=Virgibacillus ndiopensis TaxID=2004408 RepID=UPI000C08B3F1|nr:cytosolic protein [Virgibacillus ndiopensis]
MSVGKKIAKYFSNHAETSENHWDPTLTTRYYKTTKDKGLSTLEQFFRNSPEYKLNSTSKEHGELSANVKKGKKAFIVATVIMVRPYQTAIDFSVTTESMLPFDFAHSTRLIQKLYTELNKELMLIDTQPM